jgi:hypothetical protein
MTPTTTLRKFKSLTKFTYVGLPINMREQLTANRTYYVRTDGSDSNNGLANTSGGAFLTIQKAVNVVAGELDCGPYNVTIQVADGAYNANVVLYPVIGFGTYLLVGNETTPANVTITLAGSTPIQVTVGAKWSVRGLKLSTTGGAASCLFGAQNSYTIFRNMNFGACTQIHIYAADAAFISADGNYTISGGATSGHVAATMGSMVNIVGRTITITGTPAIGNFVLCGRCGVVYMPSCVFSGAATGTRYNCFSVGLIETGGGASYFPGNAAGSTTSGGVYV